MRENVKNMKFSHSLSIMINYISGPLLVVDAKDRIVDINKAIDGCIQYPTKGQIGEEFTQCYNREIITEMKREVKRFG
jgi:transcriptional regulator with PAS, ATPase and Fis domain